MEKQTRIELHDSMQDVVIKLSECNPGAMDCLCGILSFPRERICEVRMDAISLLLWIDTLHIYGTDIYVLWSDICQRDTAKMIAVLIAGKESMFPTSTIRDASSRQDYSGAKMIPVDDLYKKVIERYPRFAPEYSTDHLAATAYPSE